MLLLRSFWALGVLLSLAGWAAASCSTPLQVAQQYAPKYYQVINAIGLADSPAISQALTDPSGKHTVFMGRDMAWDALAESLHTTFDAMLVNEKERLQRIVAYNIATKLSYGPYAGMPYDNTMYIPYGTVVNLDTLLVTNSATYMLQAIAEPDPGDYYNVAKTQYYIRNPRIDTSEFSAKIPVGNAMQACNSVVFFGNSDVLQPGNGTPEY